jgi:ubiquinone/menaquinone biosynthesis C-methylase UbiE
VLADACGVGSGMRVLDVAAGTGNASIPAAQRGATVVASDLTPELLEAGRRRAGEGLDLEWQQADAEHLPFADADFDVVMSCIGAMFAPHHQSVADELVRVCRPGGTIGMLNWTPEGMIGGLFRAMKPFAPPASSRRTALRRCGAQRSTCVPCSVIASPCGRSNGGRSR